MTEFLNDFENMSQDFTEEDLVRHNNKQTHNDGVQVENDLSFPFKLHSSAAFRLCWSGCID